MVFEQLKKYNSELKELIGELERYKQIESRIRKDYATLQRQYQRKEFGYEKYQRLKKKLLSDNDLKEEIKNYDSYINLLIEKISYVNSQIFITAYEDKSYEEVRLAPKPPLSFLKPFEERLEEKKIGKIASKLDELISEPAPTPPISIEETKTQAEVEGVEKAEIPSTPTTTPGSVAKPMFLKPVKAPVSKEVSDATKTEKPKEKKKTALDLLKEQKHDKANLAVFLKDKTKTKKKLSKKQDSIVESLKKEKVKVTSNVTLGNVFNFKLVKNLVSKFRKDEGFIAKDTKKARSILELKDLIGEEEETTTLVSSNLLTKEAAQIKKLLDQQSLAIYNPSNIGYLANFFVRKITLYFLDNYPLLFKKLYEYIRKANIKILSNTYINIMFFVSFILTIIITSMTILVSLVQKNPFMLLVSKTFIMLTLTFFMTLFLFYYYPIMKVKERRKSINTNLPFAIDQMSSVVASGVSPSTMFRLIAQTKEYGDVSIEVEKISNMMEVFGYDLVSAVKTVSSTTPSDNLREFFEGFMSTIQTGGSLKNYLSQKSKEAILMYQTERQKYVETITTYSDIYTGVLIAAPLFFVSTLSLISLLGGQLGGFEISTVISMGTYVGIPLLNVAFLMFLELNQPEV
ncbi:hypothetical protein GOV05_00865 [Candidatus Woesearchaeota archaeon]|nr:hypothetical protein [Candidatus Woesearchaeota archaeon]